MSGAPTLFSNILNVIYYIDQRFIILPAKMASSGCFVKLGKSFCDRSLVGDGDETHPSAQHTELVVGIETLRATADLHDGKRLVQVTSSHNSCTFGCETSASSGSGSPDGLNVRVFAPSRSRIRAASSLARRLNERVRTEPLSRRIRG